MNSKIAVITGVSSGIGASILNALIYSDYKVYGISRTKPSFEDKHFVWIEKDLTDFPSLKTIFSEIAEDKIDVLVNNAGIIFEEPALSLSSESFHSIYDINFFAPIFLTKALKPKLENGLIINISSVSDRLIGENFALYCSSKAALNAYFEAISLEEKEIKVISILPSYVDTPLLRNLYSEGEIEWGTIIPPEKLAEFVRQVIKDEKDYVSGQKIIIVSDSLKEDLEDVENLWGYNVDTEELIKLK